jgi:hypothetical protein
MDSLETWCTFLPRHPLTYTNPYAKSQKNPSTFATCRVRTIKVYGRCGGGCGGVTMTNYKFPSFNIGKNLKKIIKNDAIKT